MVKYQNNIYIIIKIIIFQFFLLKLISGEQNECERENPIKIGNQCLSKNSSKTQFESGECIISISITS